MKTNNHFSTLAKKGIVLGALLVVTVATAGIAFLTGAIDPWRLVGAVATSNPSTTAAWQKYMSYSRDAVPSWARMVRRHSKTTSELSVLLQQSDVMYQVNGGLRSGEDQITVNAFMQGMESDPNAWKSSVQADAEATAKLNRAVFWQIGNEISSIAYSQTMRPWAINPPLTASRNDTSYIPALVEYFLAPGAEAIIAAEKKTGHEIPMVLGSVIVAGAPKTGPWLSTLLNTKIVGTYAPSLTGKYVYEVYDYIDHHYTLNTDAWGEGMSVMDSWIGKGSIRGAFDSEEIGNKAMDGGLGAERVLTAFARFMNFAAQEKLTPLQSRLNIWSEGQEEAGNAMQAVHDFMGVGSLTVVSPILADASVPVEVLGFGRGGKRMVVISAPETLSATVTSMRMASGGWKWNGTSTTGTATIFTPFGQSTQSVTGTRTKTDSVYTVPLNITLPPNGVILLLLNGS